MLDRLSFVEDLDGAEFLTFEHRETGAATGAHMGNRDRKSVV